MLPFKSKKNFKPSGEDCGEGQVQAQVLAQAWAPGFAGVRP